MIGQLAVEGQTRMAVAVTVTVKLTVDATAGTPRRQHQRADGDQAREGQAPVAGSGK